MEFVSQNRKISIATPIRIIAKSIVFPPAKQATNRTDGRFENAEPAATHSTAKSRQDAGATTLIRVARLPALGPLLFLRGRARLQGCFRRNARRRATIRRGRKRFR